MWAGSFASPCPLPLQKWRMLGVTRLKEGNIIKGGKSARL